MFLLTDEHIFPSTKDAFGDGLLCMGGDLSSDRLILAYSKGIFPWYNEDDPILWYSPDPRFVLFPERLKISQSMTQVIKRGQFNCTVNQDFPAVIHHCRLQQRKGQEGTWINPELEDAYIKLHRLGHAYSVECWKDGILAGGLYGVLVNRVFCGESMFSLEKNASKAALIFFTEYLQKTKEVILIDCQVYTPHLDSLGAEMISRIDFESYLQKVI